MIAIFLLIIAITIFIALESFFSGSEIAFMSVNRPKLFQRAKDGSPSALLVKSLLGKPEFIFSTTVVGTTLSINCSTTLVTLFSLHRWPEYTEWINLLLLTPIILILGEFIPKMYARATADQLALKVARPLYLASYLLAPFTRLLSLYAQIIQKIVGETSSKGFFLSREEIKAALPASRGSDVTYSERVLIEKILESAKITAKEMLHPLIDVIAIDEEATIRDAVKLLVESRHSRLPVYRERIDRIVGVLQGFDALRAQALDVPVKQVMREAFFVPESKPLDELLSELRARPMAIAVNEYGGAEGIITLEDVMEEIVGEIEDEYDEPSRLYHRVGDNSFIVNARMEIDELRELLNLPIPKSDEYQTLAGFLLMRMQKIPKKWDSATIDGVEYVVQSATDRSIEEVYVVVHAPAK